ncbi:MAG TPA: hypothetical protein VM555_01685 [Tahibacter sp.]|nr:hypothetical protein [Tahibacter sp.]
MKLQALALAMLAFASVNAAHAADPAKPAAQPAKAAKAEAKKPAEAAGAEAAPADPRLQAALNLTEAQIKATTNRDALTKLAQLYNGQDLQRFIWAMERLTELVPNSGVLRLQLAAVYAGQDDKTHAYDALVRLQTQGFAFQIGNDPRFDKIHGTKVWDYIVANLDANAAPFGEGKVALELPGKDRLFEALAWDPNKKQLLAGSAREGVIYRVDDKGKLSEFVKSDPAVGPWAIMDMEVDAERDALWVASFGATVYKGYDADKVNKSKLLKYSLSTGKLLAQYGSAAGSGEHAFTAIAVGKDGRVYVADAPKREVYKLDGDKLELLTTNQNLSGITGLAVSDDGTKLYIADPSLGLFGIDLKQNKPFVVSHSPDKLVVGGIDSLFWYDGALVIVQGNMVPARVMRLRLDAEGRSVKAAMPLDAAKPEFAMLGNGTVAGSDLYFVANSQREEYDSYGVPRDANALQATKVYKSDLRFAWDKPGIGTELAPIPVPRDGKVHYTPSKGRAPANQAQDPAKKDGN